MPRNGSGTYNLPAGNPVVPGTVISSSGWANPTLSDISAALTQSMSSDGQTIPTANQSLGNFRHTNVANAIQRNEYAAYGQVQDGQPQWMTVSGVDTILGTIAPGPTSYTAGQLFRFIPAGSNTGPATLNINSIGAKAVTKFGTVALAAGDLVGGKVYEAIYDGTQFQLLTQAATQTATGSYSVYGLVGINNAGTPNTKYDVAADSVTLRSTNGTPSITRFGTGTITNDVGLAGPAANGRDQAGSFGASNWIHFYFIWNGSTLATISSLVAPATGPTLPTGYTHWAYAGSVFFDVSSHLVVTRWKGCYATYDNEPAALVNGTATIETNIVVSSLIPPNALSYSCNFRQSPTGSAGGFAEIVTVFGVAAGLTFSQYPYRGYNGSVSSALGLGFSGSVPNIPNVGQILLYRNVNTTGTGSLTVTVTGYKMPNGGE